MSEKDPVERAMEAAGRLLRHRARTESELRTRLQQKEFEPPVVDATIARLYELQLLDDEAFALARAEGIARQNGGPQLMLSRLASGGIDAPMARAAVAGVVEATGGEDALARQALGRRYPDLADAVVRRKAANWLVQRGFSTEVAGRAAGVSEDQLD